ncbi:hypothetical protein MG293_001832 [Ovis ammon polii]|uniref:Uncharacterized protein n=1 Tax=Ovis ammon polii TaxID=230172 RepID=A0AAD4UQS1_OVIAM|nr:hypothetical protein MG293_001832 [Ovis ammon polii]
MTQRERLMDWLSDRGEGYSLTVCCDPGSLMGMRIPIPKELPDWSDTPTDTQFPYSEWWVSGVGSHFLSCLPHSASSKDAFLDPTGKVKYCQQYAHHTPDTAILASPPESEQLASDSVSFFTRYCAKHFVARGSFNPHKYPMRGSTETQLGIANHRSRQRTALPSDTKAAGDKRVGFSQVSTADI